MTHYKDMIGKFRIHMLVLLVAGCAVQSPNNRSYISEGIKERTNYELGQASKPGQFDIPEWVTLDDGLSQDEAVALALWNNAQLQADLAALGFARADLLEANMLSNPVFSVLFPVSPKLLEMAMDIPIDALWQRPHRVAVAELDAKRLSENLIEHGLGLIRDVQTTYADLWSAKERVRLAEQNARLRFQMAELVQVQLRAGDISKLAASDSYVDTLRATDTVKRFSKEVDILEQRLHSLLGITSDDIIFNIAPSQIPLISAVSVDELLKTAFAARPDLRAAELAIEAAGKRIGWEQSKIYNFIAIIDAKDEGEDSLTVGPGLAIDIPIFNQNNAKIAYAKAELEQAARRYEAIRQNIILEVNQAYTQYISAHEQFDLWNNDIIPYLEQAAEQTRISYDAGETLLISVLNAQGKLIDARMHVTELVARLNSSTAELNYCVGKKMINIESKF